MNATRFKVFHAVLASSEHIQLGIATMDYRGARSFKPSREPVAETWFEGRTDGFLADFRKEVYRLVHSLGHDSKWCETWDEETGLGVTRI